MVRPSLIKLALVSATMLTIAGIGYGGLVIWRDKLTIESEHERSVDEKKPADQEAVSESPAFGRSPEARFSERIPNVDTLGWKSYRNEEFSFEIKYPPELVGLERAYSSPDAVGGINFRLPTQDATNPAEPYGFLGRRFWKHGVPDQCEPPQWASGVQQTQIEIGGVTFSRNEYESSDECCPLVAIAYTGKYEDICYRLTYSHHGEPDSDTVREVQDAISRFEQIVATFTSLETTQR
ncbi:MAG: hypothetical protein HYW95_02460 [Candidatus Wildermuthbacteria bacterium]|nr:hypothetical protein [Candidatus Wildermuthbacteria bacterium]